MIKIHRIKIQHEPMSIAKLVTVHLSGTMIGIVIGGVVLGPFLGAVAAQAYLYGQRR